jgi:hypothetical protein
MEKLSGPSIDLGQTFCASRGSSVKWPLWPGAEDKALRGRNLSAVFRTLNRQVGKLLKSFLSCAQTWRVENQCDKSTLRTCERYLLLQKRAAENSFHRALKKVLTKQSNRLSIFSGQAQ